MIPSCTMALLRTAENLHHENGIDVACGSRTTKLILSKMSPLSPRKETLAADINDFAFGPPTGHVYLH